MKLRNKKTGEIGELQITEKHCVVVVGNGTADCNVKLYCTLDKLNEEWEDYEEPKEPKKYWFINSGGGTASYYEEDEEPEDTEACKEIGNYFDTREEAEKAVEKLKAWKRLKDKGFINEQVFSMNLNWCNPDDDDWKAFKLLFGGEE